MKGGGKQMSGKYAVPVDKLMKQARTRSGRKTKAKWQGVNAAKRLLEKMDAQKQK